MSAKPAIPAAGESYVVSHGKCGAVGVFTAIGPEPLRRGRRVLVETLRGVEFGQVLCKATDRQAVLFGAASAGRLLRCIGESDDIRRASLVVLEQQIFDAARDHVTRQALPLEVLDIEVLFDGSAAILQFVGREENIEELAHSLEQQFKIGVQIENLAMSAHKDEEAHHCDKPDCGRHAEGGCSTCGTGGGCSSCGAGEVDLRPYFAHLRAKMEEQHRIPLA